jgi:hypothetical protein
VNVAFIGSGTLAGFTAKNIELDGASVLTLPKSASELAEALEGAGKYVTKNADETWSVANNFQLQIQVADGVASLGFLKDTRRTYTVEASSDLSTWSAITTEGDTETQGSDVAVPLEWHKPAGGRFFRVKATDAE